MLKLTPSSNSCVKQIVNNIYKGIYTIRLEYGAHKNRPPADSEVTIKVNGIVVNVLRTDSYEIQHVNVVVLLEEDHKQV